MVTAIPGDNSIHNSALLGLTRSRQGLARAADDIARYPVKNNATDLNRSLLELRRHEQAAKANVQTLKTANDTLGTLLDEMA